MLICADGKPLRRNLILCTGVNSSAFLKMMQWTGYWSGGKIVWAPSHNGALHDILWAHPDPNEPIPEWVQRIPIFKIASTALTSASSSPWVKDPTWNNAANTISALGHGGSGGVHQPVLVVVVVAVNSLERQL
jgi:hypothetical protein